MLKFCFICFCIMLFCLAVFFLFNFFRCLLTFHNLTSFPLGVYTFFGVPGSGKTTFASACVSIFSKKGFPVYSNVPLKGAIKISKDDIGTYNLPLFGKPYCLLVYDECSIDYDNRNFKNNFKDFQQAYWRLHRHYHVLAFLFSQSYNDMDKKLRNLTQKYYMISHFGKFFTFARGIKKVVGINDVSGEIQDCYIFDKGFFAFLKTFTIWSRLYWKNFDSWDAPYLPDLPNIEYW